MHTNKSNCLPAVRDLQHRLLGRKCFKGVNALDRQDVSCMHLAHHELESVLLLLFICH